MKEAGGKYQVIVQAERSSHRIAQLNFQPAYLQDSKDLNYS